ncbi:hypothetical protein BDV29DRAFT_193684 [Aspergillus leporis]|uniref:monoamine oxidase n=1 Tax=Aspergillus leporis TaxID=41062 RepID=A0A5N5WQR3_9EURO|nr:hypothetical protein BDV29DRAFT_193684 [Aspergillus leporis]
MAPIICLPACQRAGRRPAPAPSSPSATPLHSTTDPTWPAQRYGSFDKALHVSGQPGTLLGGQAPSDYRPQLHLALLNVHRVIIAAGATLRNIVKLNLYIVNYDPQNRLHVRPLQKWLGTHAPAITLTPRRKIPAHPSASTLTSRMQPPEEVDIVVVGPDLSGLTAEEPIINHGYSCIVLEARDRVGGRPWYLLLVRRAGAELIEENTTRNCLLQEEIGQTTVFAYGQTPKLSPPCQTMQAQMEAVQDTVEADCQNADCSYPHNPGTDSLTFLAYLQSCGASEMAIANASALYFLDYCKSDGGLLRMLSHREHGARYLRVRQGTQIFTKTIAADHYVLVESNGHLIEACKVIASMPTLVLKIIGFELPLQKLLTGSFRYGYYTRVMLVFRSAWRVGLAQSFCGPVSVFRDTSSPAYKNGFSLPSWPVAVTLGNCWGMSGIAKDCLDGTCPCPSLPPGVLSVPGRYSSWPFKNTHFVGTETAAEWKGHMEGAVRSGERGASEVISVFSKSRMSHL